MCDSVAEVSDDVDLVFIADCNGDGSDHLQLARPGLEKGVATFVDKPLAFAVEDARSLIELAAAHDAPLASASILQALPGAAQFGRRLDEVGELQFGSVQGGGPTLAGQIHTICLALRIFGDGVLTVHAMGDAVPDTIHLDYGDLPDRPARGVTLSCDVGAVWHCAFHVSAYGPEGRHPLPTAGRFRVSLRGSCHSAPGEGRCRRRQDGRFSAADARSRDYRRGDKGITRRGSSQNTAGGNQIGAQSKSMTIVHCHHHGFTVSDVNRSISFYRDALGLELLRVTARRNLPSYDRILGYDDVVLQVALLCHPASEFLLELIEYQHPKGKTRPLENTVAGASHVAFEVDDVDAVYSRLQAAGYGAINPPVDVEREGAVVARAFYALDPDGISVELFQEFADLVKG